MNISLQISDLGKLQAMMNVLGPSNRLRLNKGETAKPGEKPSLSPEEQELIEAAKRVGWPGIFDDLK